MQAFLEPEPPVQDKPVLWMQALEGAQWGSEPLACIEDLGRLLTHGGPIPRRVLARIWGELVEHHRQHQRRIPVEISQIFQEINRSRGCA